MSEKLTETDRKLVYALAENARTPLTQIAKKLRMSRDTLNYRVQRLQDIGVVETFVPVVDVSFFGHNVYMVYYVTRDANKERRKEFVEKLVKHPHTRRVMEYTDRWELAWELIAEDIHEFDAVVSAVATEYSDVIQEKNNLKLVRGYKSMLLPERYLPSHDHEFNYKKKEYAPDEKDIALLSALAPDARTSSYEIAEKIGISANNVRYRMKHMEQAQLIRKYTIEANLAKLDYHPYTVCVVLKYLDNKKEAKLKEFIKGQRFIIRAVKVIGHWDLILTIVADSLRNFHSTVMEFQEAFSDIIVNYETLISYKEHCHVAFPKVLGK